MEELQEWIFIKDVTKYSANSSCTMALERSNMFQIATAPELELKPQLLNISPDMSNVRPSRQPWHEGRFLMDLGLNYKTVLWQSAALSFIFQKSMLQIWVSHFTLGSVSLLSGNYLKVKSDLSHLKWITVISNKTIIQLLNEINLLLLVVFTSEEIILVWSLKRALIS